MKAEFVTMILAVIGLAIVAVVVSQKATTGTLLQGFGTAFSGVIGAATGPLGS